MLRTVERRAHRIGTSAALGMTGGQFPIVTDGGDQAVSRRNAHRTLRGHIPERVARAGTPALLCPGPVFPVDIIERPGPVDLAVECPSRSNVPVLCGAPA